MTQCNVQVPAALTGRNRLTTAFRPILALPHLLLVGGPITLGVFFAQGNDDNRALQGGAGGVFGAVAVVCAFLAWFAIIFTGKHPDGLWKLTAFYLRWRVRATSYLTLLRDEYPPFDDSPYPAELLLERPDAPRNRVSVAFRLLLVLPHVFLLFSLGIAWFVTTIISWFAILFTGEYPAELYNFGVGVLRWSTRVEAYMLLLRDEYPPFSLKQGGE